MLKLNSVAVVCHCGLVVVDFPVIRAGLADKVMVRECQNCGRSVALDLEAVRFGALGAFVASKADAPTVKLPVYRGPLKPT